jgi:tRNA(fMet)-specific endonuclease VapC
MKYLLDTDISVYLLNGNETLEQRVHSIGVSAIRISIVTLSELYYGAYGSRRTEENIKRIQEFAGKLRIYLWSPLSARRFGEIKSELRKAGKLIEDFDILIASIAIVNDCTLVTHNVKHFERIPHLEIEDWLGE